VAKDYKTFENPKVMIRKKGRIKPYNFLGI